MPQSRKVHNLNHLPKLNKLERTNLPVKVVEITLIISENGDCTFQRRQLFSLYWGEPAISQSTGNVYRFKAMYKPNFMGMQYGDVIEKEGEKNKAFQITSIKFL